MRTASDTLQLVTERLRESIEVKQALLQSEEFLTLVAEVAHVIAKSLYRSGRVFFFGNGGSAADAQHLAAELAGRYLRERPGLGGLAMTTNTSCLTAIGNDYGYDLVFARQLQAIREKSCGRCDRLRKCSVVNEQKCGQRVKDVNEAASPQITKFECNVSLLMSPGPKLKLSLS